MNYPKTKFKPWDHQVQALNLCMDHPGYMLAHDMGTGKSKTTIDLINAISPHRALIVCPKTVIPVWPYQFEIHSGREYEVLCLDGIRGPRGGLNTSIQARADLLKKRLESKEPLIVVVNYESVWQPPLGPTRKGKRIIDIGVIKKQRWDMIVLDESHRIKAPGGTTSWFFKGLADRAGRRYCLTGTPLPHSPLDAYAQYRFLDTRVFGTSYTRFRARYAVMGGFNNRQVLSFQNMDEFRDLFNSIAHIVKKEDVLDLPPVIHETRHYELSDKSRKIYNELQTDLRTDLEAGTVVAENALTKLLRLQQVTGGFVRTDANRDVQIGHEALDVLKDLLEDIPQSEPVVIFCRFHAEIDMIKAAAEKAGRNVMELSGRENQYIEFRKSITSKKPTTIVVQIQAGDVGIDFTPVRYCIYYSLGFSLANFLQSVARTNRPGQLEKVTYYHLIAKGTVDEALYRALHKREELVTAAVNYVKGGS